VKFSHRANFWILLSNFGELSLEIEDLALNLTVYLLHKVGKVCKGLKRGDGHVSISEKKRRTRRDIS